MSLGYALGAPYLTLLGQSEPSMGCGQECQWDGETYLLSYLKACRALAPSHANWGALVDGFYHWNSPYCF